MIDLTLKIEGARDGQDLLDALHTAMTSMIRHRIQDCADGDVITGSTNGNAEFRIKVARQDDHHQPNVAAIRGRILEYINDGLSDADIGWELGRRGVFVPLREIAGIVRACAEATPAQEPITQHWECPACGYCLPVTEYDYSRLAADGIPICSAPDCETDMELKLA